MGNFILVIVILGIAAVVFVCGALRKRARLRPFWSRRCTGPQWRRRFPQASNADIRAFLDLFLDAFGFGDSRRLCFAPHDRIMDVYRAVYPPMAMSDSMELVSLLLMVEERYGVDLSPHWRDDITLGELYEHVIARVR